MTKSFPLTPPAAFVPASKKGGIGKTFLMATVADLMTVNGYPYSVFQADDKKRLGSLIGAKVVDLWPNLDLVMGDPALVRKAFTPLYTACSETVARGKSVLFDIGADEVEDAANFLTRRGDRRRSRCLGASDDNLRPSPDRKPAGARPA